MPNARKVSRGTNEVGDCFRTHVNWVEEKCAPADCTRQAMACPLSFLCIATDEVLKTMSIEEGNPHKCVPDEYESGGTHQYQPDEEGDSGDALNVPFAKNAPTAIDHKGNKTYSNDQN